MSFENFLYDVIFQQYVLGKNIVEVPKTKDQETKLGKRKKGYINILKKRGLHTRSIEKQIRSCHEEFIVDQLYIKASSTKSINFWNREDLSKELNCLRKGDFSKVVEMTMRGKNRQALIHYYATELFANEIITKSLKNYFITNASMTIKFSNLTNKIEHYRFIKYWDRKKVLIKYLDQSFTETDIIKLWKGYKGKYIYIDFGIQNIDENNIKEMMIKKVCKSLPNIDIYNKEMPDFEKNYCKDILHYYLKNYVIPSLSKLCFKEIYKKAKLNYLNNIRDQLNELYDKKPIKNTNIMCIVADYVNGCCCRVYDKNEQAVDKFEIYLDSYKKIINNDYKEIEDKINNCINEIKSMNDSMIMTSNEMNKNEYIERINKKKNIRNRLRRKLNKLKYKICLFKDNKKELCDKIKKYEIQLIAIGNGSFSGEVEDILRQIIKENENVKYVVLDELKKEKKSISIEERDNLLDERNRSIYNQLVNPFEEYSQSPLEALHYYDNNSCDIISEKTINRLIKEVTENHKKMIDNNNVYDINNINNNQQESLIPKSLDKLINATLLCRRIDATAFSLNLPISGIYRVPPFYKKCIKYLFQRNTKRIADKKLLGMVQDEKNKKNELEILSKNYTEYLKSIKHQTIVKMKLNKIIYRRLYLSLIDDYELLEKRRKSMKKRYLYENIPYCTNLDEPNKKIIGKVTKIEKNYCLVRESKYGNIGRLYQEDYNSYTPTVGDEKQFNIIFSAIDEIKLVAGEMNSFRKFLKNIKNIKGFDLI